jgi:hypothetical protein
MYPISSTTNVSTIVTRYGDVVGSPSVDGANLTSLLYRVMTLLTDDTGDAELAMVREGGMSSRTVLAVANKAWLEKNGEFVFRSDAPGEREKRAIEEIKSSPRHYLVVALTNMLFRCTELTELYRAEHMLTLWGLSPDSYLISEASAFVWPDSHENVHTGSTTYKEVYGRMRSHLVNLGSY